MNGYGDASACVYGKLGKSPKRKWQTSLDAVLTNTSHTNEGILVKVIGEYPVAIYCIGLSPMKAYARQGMPH